MGSKDMVAVKAKGEEKARLQRAKELWERVQEVRRDVVVLGIETGELLKDIRDGEYYQEMGYTSFEAFCQTQMGFTRQTAYRYIQAVEGFSDKLPPEIVTRVTTGDNPLPLRILAGLHFDQNALPEGEIERLKKLPAEALKAELVRLGYDRGVMGGRGPADVGRRLIERKTYRDQRRKIQKLAEERETTEAENEELRENLKQMQARLDQILEAMKDPQAQKVVKTLDNLTEEVARLTRAQAEAEAEIATGKEVGARALALIGEVQVLCAAFERTVRIDTKAQWMEVRACFDTAREALNESRDRLAETIISRMEAGEIREFNVEDPGALGRAAEFGLREPKVRL